MLHHRKVQVTDSHCGPAVIQMLLAQQGVDVTQEALTEAAGATSTIEKLGTRVDQLAASVRLLSPQHRLYYKTYSEIADIDTLLYSYHLPVAVNWQGMFYENEDEEDKEWLAKGEYGHYSIVKRIDYENRTLIIVDPYRDFADTDRVIAIKKFIPRWWDLDPRTDPQSWLRDMVRYERLLFVVSAWKSELTQKLGMKTFY